MIASKVHYAMTNKPNMGGLSRKHIIQACEASLKRLGVETIDLYQIHRFDPDTPIEETLAALDQLVHQGKIQYIGASAGYAWQFARALYASDRNGVGAVRVDAAALQPHLSRGRARDDSVLYRGRRRLHPVLPTGPGNPRHAHNSRSLPVRLPRFARGATH